jgi:hypothetical protein
VLQVKDGVIDTLKGFYEIETQLLEVVRNTVADALKATGAVAGDAISVTKDVLKGAVSGTEEVGTGLLLSVKSLAKGIVMGVGDVGSDVLAVARETIRGIGWIPPRWGCRMGSNSVCASPERSPATRMCSSWTNPVPRWILWPRHGSRISSRPCEDSTPSSS